MAAYKRVLLKLSGEYLGGNSGQGYDPKTVDSLAEKIKKIHEMGLEIGIVPGGGNFFRGAQGAGFPMDRVKGDQIGMLATMMNALYLAEALKAKGVKTQVMAGIRVPQAADDFSKVQALKYFTEGQVVIFGGGTGNPYFSTDTAAVLRGLEIDAEIVIKGTKVDGVYDKDPMKHGDAVKYTSLSFSEVLAQDLKVMDQAAIALAKENNLAIGVVDLTSDRGLLDFLEGKEIGTKVQ